MSNNAGLLEPPNPMKTEPSLVTEGVRPEKRLAPLSPQDLGEQVIGSDHHFPVTGLLNLSDKPAMVRSSIEGSAALRVTELPELIAPMQQAPLTIEYAPLGPGDQHAQLTLNARWSDGHEETSNTPIVARARSLEDAPRSDAAATSTPATVVEPAPDKHAPALAVVTNGMEKLRGTISALILEQKSGVDTVRDEQGHFKAAPVDPSIWLDLVDVAIAMATDGVGEIVEHLVLKAVEKIGTHLVKKAAHHAAVAIAHASEHEAESLTAKTIAASVGGGVKHLIEHHLGEGGERAEASEGGGSDEHHGGGKHMETSFSSNPTVDFFARQQHVLNGASAAAIKQVADMEMRLAPLASRSPDDALATIEAITGAVEQAFEQALVTQAQATAAQFAAFKARLALGSEEVRLGLKSRTVTKLDEARHYDGVAAPENPKGLLEIRTEASPSEVRVIGAHIDGVGRAVADRLLEIDLAARGVPLRIVLGGSYGVITRDEVGRVRYSGYLPVDADSRQGSDEVQQLRGAERIASLVLSRSLRDWGVAAVETNDVGKEDE